MRLFNKIWFDVIDLSSKMNLLKISFGLLFFSPDFLQSFYAPIPSTHRENKTIR